MSDPTTPNTPPDPVTEKVVADEVSFRARALELDMRERVDQNTRERLDATANFVGIVAAVVFGIFGLGTYLLVQSLVGGEVRTQLSERLGVLEADVARSIDDQGRTVTASVDAEIERMNVELEATVAELEAAVAALEAERSLATLLPLVVGEAIDIDSEGPPIAGAGPTYSEQLVIDAMSQIAPAVENLDGFAFDLAARRIERILDVFWERGRYFEMHEILNAMSPELQLRLLGHPTQGILYTVSDGLASELLQEGALPPSRRGVLNRVLDQNVRPDEFAAVPMAILTVFVVADDLGWTHADVGDELRRHASRWTEFEAIFLYNQVCYIADDLPDDLAQASDLDRDLRDRLVALSAVFSDAPLQQVCSGFSYDTD